MLAKLASSSRRQIKKVYVPILSFKCITLKLEKKKENFFRHGTFSANFGEKAETWYQGAAYFNTILWVSSLFPTVC